MGTNDPQQCEAQNQEDDDQLVAKAGLRNCMKVQQEADLMWVHEHQMMMVHGEDHSQY